MNLDSLARLIQSADFSTFRELAIVCLSLRGYREVTLTDGWSDGGTDVRVYQMPPTPSDIAFQITVEWDWKSKLRGDAAKAKKNLGLDHMTLVSSRRIAESEFQEVADEILKEIGVHVNRIDSQGMASTFFRSSKTIQVLQILGITPAEEHHYKDTFSARDNIAWSFVFFGGDSHNFREAIVESAIIDRLAHLGSISRPELQTVIATILSFAPGQETRITSAIDRMLQRGDLRAADGKIALQTELAETAMGMHVLRDTEWQHLVGEIKTFIKSMIKRRLSPSNVDAICSDISALLIESADATTSTFGLSGQSFAKTETIRKRVRSLHATLDTLGFPEGSARDVALEQLTKIVSEHPFGKRLLMGELYLAISSAATPQLIRAFGAQADVRILLDASVAMPMLCSLLFRPTKTHSSFSAQETYTRAIDHGFHCMLPIDYLEEVTTHLIDAYRLYSSIIDHDPDLRSSDNAFVSHYAGMKYEGTFGESFEEYVGAFGLDQNLRRSEFYHTRDLLKSRIERLFNQYRITPTRLGDASRPSLKKAEEDISHAMQGHNIERAQILIRHDIRTLAFLYDQDRQTDDAWVLCTWDRLHFLARDANAAQWITANPAALADLMSIAKPTNVEHPSLVSTHVFALMLTEEAAALGANVWATLAKIDRDILHDAQLISLAQGFKRDYLRKIREGDVAQSIENEWERWKSQHIRS